MLAPSELHWYIFFLVFLLCSVCVRKCVHVCDVQICAGAHTHVYIGQSSTSSAFHNHSPLYFLKQHLSLYLELTNLARLVSQWVLRTCQPPPTTSPTLLCYRQKLQGLAFMWVPRDPNSDPHICLTSIWLSEPSFQCCSVIFAVISLSHSYNKLLSPLSPEITKQPYT